MRAFQIIIGIILLLPGLCSLAFMSGGGVVSGGLRGLWLPCLLVSAFGLWLIFKPNKQSETRYFRDVERDGEEPK